MGEVGFAWDSGVAGVGGVEVRKQNVWEVVHLSLMVLVFQSNSITTIIHQLKAVDAKYSDAAIEHHEGRKAVCVCAFPSLS